MRSHPAVWALGLAAATVLAQSAPVRTPTPARRLSGGFGRLRATAAPVGDGGGQTLPDVVRSAHDAKSGESPAREKSSLTIDNRTLATNRDKGRVSSSKPAPAKARVEPDAPSPPSAATRAEPTPAQSSETQWREKAAAARQRVADGKARIAELEATVKKLETDFYAWDDGQYRDRVIKPAWDKTRTQLEDARRELAAAEKDLADLPEKARVAGALPGWIRE